MSAFDAFLRRARRHQDNEARTDVFDHVEAVQNQRERERYLGVDVIQDDDSGTVAFVDWSAPGRYIETDTMEVYA